MEEKSNVEIIEDFAKRSGRTVSVLEKLYPKTGIQTFQKYQTKIVVSDSSENSSFFIWLSDPYAKIGIPSIFCGVFLPLKIKDNSQLSIRKKNILDRLSVFSKTKKYITENPKFNSKVLITGDLSLEIEKILENRNIQDLILDALNLSNVFVLSFNHHQIDFVPELKDNSYLSITNNQSWFMDKNTIEDLFKIAEKINHAIERS